MISVPKSFLPVQVDYGMLHGAQANISTIDLKSEASYFAKLSDDISRMSCDATGLASGGSRILEIDMTLSKWVMAVGSCAIENFWQCIAKKAVTMFIWISLIYL